MLASQVCVDFNMFGMEDVEAESPLCAAAVCVTFEKTKLLGPKAAT